MGLNEKFFKSADTPYINPFFNTVLYTGNGTSDSSLNSVTEVGFAPDFVWIKNREEGRNHVLVDSLRKTGSLHDELHSNNTDAENTTGTDNVKSLDSDGFTLLGQGSETNDSGDTFVAWCWEAGGAPNGSHKVSIDGTSYSNEASAGLTAGTIAVSGLSVNTSLGFSIATVVDHTNTKTISHGLGAAPELIIAKVTNDSSYGNWYVYHKDLGNTKYLNLNTTGAAGTDNFWNNTSPTSQVFTHRFSTTALDVVYYCFRSVAGVSKVGSFVGSGGGGKKITLDFEPSWILTKRTSTSGGSWYIIDNKRSTASIKSDYLQADSAASEATASSGITFDTDGFTFSGASFNASGATHIYYAIA